MTFWGHAVGRWRGRHQRLPASGPGLRGLDSPWHRADAPILYLIVHLNWVLGPCTGPPGCHCLFWALTSQPAQGTQDRPEAALGRRVGLMSSPPRGTEQQHTRPGLRSAAP